MRLVVICALVAVAPALSSCEGCGGAPPLSKSFTVTSGDTSLLVELEPFAFSVRDGGASAVGDLDCAPLTLALRSVDDTGAWHKPEAPSGDEVWLRSSSAVLVREDPLTLDVTLVDDAGKLTRTANVILTASEDGFVDLDVAFDEDELNIAYVGTCLALADDEHLVGGGERFDGPDLRGKVVPLYFDAPGDLASGTNEAHAPVPFFASSKGYSLLVDTERVGAFDVGASQAGRTIVRFHGAGLALALRKGPVVDDVAALARRMGLPPAPPVWALAPMQWRNDLEVTQDDQGNVVSSGTDMLLADVEEMRARGIPNSTIWIDAPWETGYNTFVFNELQLPGIKETLKDLDAQGLRVLTWATEHVNTSDDSDQAFGMPAFASRNMFERYVDNHFLVIDDSGEPFQFPWGRGTGAFVDFTNASACAQWKQDMRPLLDDGVYGFKLDYGETMRPDVLGLLPNDLPRFSDGTTTAVQHTRYARLYHECYLAALDDAHGDDKFIITRTGGIYDQKNGTAIWPGDLDNGFEKHRQEIDGDLAVGGLPAALAGYLSLAMSAYPLYGSDIGGYRGGMPSTEVFARWSQMGALSTVMQVGGGGNQAPWDPELVDVVDIYKTAARLHMDLVPMFVEWMDRASRNGTPVAVPVGVVANDEDAWKDAATFVLGDVLLAAPVIEDGARTRELFVPEGTWYSWWDGKEVTGPGAVTVDAPLELVPLFLKDDGIVVLSDPRLMTVLDNGDAVGGNDDMGTRRVVRTFTGGAAQAVVGDVVALRSQDGGATTVDVVADGGRPLVVDLWLKAGESVGSATISGRDDALTVTTEEALLECADACVLVEDHRVRAAATGRQLTLTVAP
jgi:alpha-D-xyloside xylohydrolase